VDHPEQNVILSPVTDSIKVGKELIYGTAVGMDEIVLPRAMEVRSERAGVIG
jgi:hypothetical protein